MNAELFFTTFWDKPLSYSAKYIDHFTNPRGIGELDPNDGWSEVEHAGGGCFDRVKLTLQIADGKITNAKFRARACSGTIAACSALVEKITGMNLPDVEAITPDDLTDYLDGIPEKKRHSVELAIEALTDALTNKL